MNRYVVNCKTQDEAELVLQIAHKEGLKWHIAEPGCHSLLINTMWNAHKERTCYNFGYWKGVRFGSVHYYESGGFVIVSAQDFIEADRKQKEENETN